MSSEPNEAQDTPESGPGTVEERMAQAAEAQRSGNPGGVGDAVKGDVPRAPDFRDRGGEGGNRLLVGQLPTEREQYQLEDAVFNQPGEKGYSESEVAAAEEQHDLALEQARIVQGKGAGIKKHDSTLTSTTGAGGVDDAINTETLDTDTPAEDDTAFDRSRGTPRGE